MEHPARTFLPDDNGEQNLGVGGIPKRENPEQSDEKILKDSVKLPDIPTSKPDGSLPQHISEMKKVRLIETGEISPEAAKIALALNEKIQRLLPKNNTSVGLPETIEELAEMALAFEAIIDEMSVTINAELNDDEYAALTLLSTIAESVKRTESAYAKGTGKTKESKIVSAKFQQEAFSTMFRFYDSSTQSFGQFDSLFTSIMQISEMYLNGKTVGFEDRSVVKEWGSIDGFRGMLTNAILLRDAGLNVYLPEPEDDVFCGSDLVTVIEGDKVAINIKAKLGNLDLQDTNRLNASMSFVTNSAFNNAWYVYLETPNIYNATTTRSDLFFDISREEGIDPDPRIFLGLPSALSRKWMQQEVVLLRNRIKASQKEIRR